MRFSLMFFSSAADAPDPYRLMIEAARFADRNGFAGVWTPERHFGRFGGVFANPAVTSAALAAVTERLQVRAGSLISPLHDVIRIAEEWAMVDQISAGRAAISFGSGWNINDFVFFPERYEQRQSIMYEQISALKAIWREGKAIRKDASGKESEFEVYPRPRQSEIPFWITSSGNERTFAAAGKLGANLLTHLIFQDKSALGRKVQVYREAREESGHPRGGVVTLMLHTFLGRDKRVVKEFVRPKLKEYLRDGLELEINASRAGGAVSGNLTLPVHDIPTEAIEELLEVTFERYFEHASCMGTLDDALRAVKGFEDAGVDEIACLIDFGIPMEDVMESLVELVALNRAFGA
jgi:natural product biosynthesis luciferase-like monooxygenase protein